MIVSQDMNALTLSVKKGDKKMYEDTQHQTDFFEEEEELSPSQVWDDVMAGFFPNAQTEEELEEELESWIKFD